MDLCGGIKVSIPLLFLRQMETRLELKTTFSHAIGPGVMLQRGQAQVAGTSLHTGAVGTANLGAGGPGEVNRSVIFCEVLGGVHLGRGCWSPGLASLWALGCTDYCLVRRAAWLMVPVDPTTNQLAIRIWRADSAQWKFVGY